MQLRSLAVPLLLSLFVLGCTTASRDVSTDPIEVTETLQPGTRAYGSADAILGALGRKRTSSERRPAFFERVTLPEWRDLKIHNAGTIERSKTGIRELQELGLSAPALAALEANARSERSNNYKLVLLQILDGLDVAEELRRLADSQPAVRQLLFEPNVRLVTAVEAVFDHETRAKFEAAAGASASAVRVGAYDVAVELKGGGSRDETIRLSNGTIVAYRFARLCWTADGSSLTLITDVGGRDSCPPNTSEAPPVSASLPMPTGEALQNINWALTDTGSPDCEREYRSLAPECLAVGAYRRCAMDKAVRAARNGDCEAAYNLTLLTQCHNAGARLSLVNAGKQPICNYLKTR